MQCRECGCLSPDGSNFCFECGECLDPEGFALENPNQALDDIPAMGWFLVLILDIFTLGVYSRVWFIRRWRAFNGLASHRQLNPGLLYAVLLFYLCTLVLIPASLLRGLEVTTPIPPWLGDSLWVVLDNLSTVLSLGGVILIIHQGLTLRRMLKDHARAAFGHTLGIGWFWTLIFGAVNLQYAINRLKSVDKTS